MMSKTEFDTKTLFEYLSVAGANASIVADETFFVFLVPDKVIARITAEPRLPAIPIVLQLNPGFSLNGEASYSSFIDYREHGRNDKSHTVQGRTNTLNFSINFGAIIQGGTFHLDLTVPWRHTSGATGVQQFQGVSSIRGVNPPKTDVRSRLSDIALQVTAYRESRFRQFAADELPLFGAPNGFGIMQLDTPPATARQVWDWKENVDAGAALFAQKKQDARTYPARVRRQFPDAVDFDAEQLKLETYQRYNGGGYWQWNDIDKRWAAGTTNGYADESRRIEMLVNAGTPPADWN
jgi:hypothetical protein